MTAPTQRLLRELARELDDAGLRGCFLVRDLASGDEVGIDPDTTVPLASLVKVPLAVAVLDRVRTGGLDAARRIEVVPPAEPLPGPAGLSRFRHPASVAVDDLLYLSVALSDNVATDALFALVDPAAVTALLADLGLTDLVVRHEMAELADTPVDDLPGSPDLALTLAAAGATAGGGHRVRQLDVSQASTGTPRALVELLELLWVPGSGVGSGIDPAVAARVRGLMADNVQRQRLWPDFASDAATWSSKTATVLNLRHEMGVVEHADGPAYAVAALTESRVPALVQPHAEATMARVARRLRDHLRSTSGP